MTLTEVLAGFLAEHGQRWATPQGADGRCHEATSRFVVWARDRGLRAAFVKAMHVNWGLGQNAAMIGDVVIDWTARGNSPQVDGRRGAGRGWDPEAPLPKVWGSLPAFVTAWGYAVPVCPECGSERHRFGRCLGPWLYDDPGAMAARIREASG